MISERNWSSQLVKNLQNDYKYYDDLVERITFLVNTYLAYRNDRSFGEYDPAVIVDEKTEIERNELQRFLQIEFTKIKSAFKDVRSNNISKQVDEIFSNRIDLSPVKWLKSEDSLRKFIEMLISHKLIEKNDIDLLMGNFNSGFNVGEHIPPLVWLDSVALLAYMIEKIDNEYIKPRNLWKDITPHFAVDGKAPKNMKQTANRYKNNKSGKPKNYQLIDQIISNLPEK